MRLFFIGIIITSLLGAGAYVLKLQRDNVILNENAIKLEANKKINELVNHLKKDLDDLDKRFSKKDRDIGKLAIDRTKVIERIINKGSDNATRCIEIASGSPLTESEKNATKKSEINPECPSIANPKYIPY